MRFTLISLAPAGPGLRIDMRAYLIVTAIIAGLLAAAHIARVVLGEPHLARDPWFIGATLVAAGVCAWSVVLLRRRPRKGH